MSQVQPITAWPSAKEGFFARSAPVAASPSDMGVLLHHKLLELAASGQFALSADNSVEIPVTATLTMPDPQIESQVCGMSCIHILGTPVACVSICHTEQ